MTSVEIWREIPSYPAYEVSSFGRVRRKGGGPKAIGMVGPRRSYANVQLSNPESATVRRQRLAREGMSDEEINTYMRTHRAKRMVNARVHLLVLETFVGPRPPGAVACHNDGDTKNNRLENLRWDTRSANELDKVAHGTHHQKLKTHCPSGHEYTPENCYDPTMRARRCKTCARERARAQYASGYVPPNRRKS